jgi:hypothetical protein
MNRLVPVATLVAAFAPGGTASAAGVPTLPLAAPPIAANPASSQIFDAFVAIGRAAVTNPGGAQAASFPYAAALQQYNAGDYERAQQSAIEAIGKTAAPTYPQPNNTAPNNTAPNVSPPPVVRMPDVGTVQFAESEERVAVARRALESCGPTTSQQFITASASYQAAADDAVAHHWAAVVRETQAVVDTCAAVPAQSSPPATAQ